MISFCILKSASQPIPKEVVLSILVAMSNTTRRLPDVKSTQSEIYIFSLSFAIPSKNPVYANNVVTFAGLVVRSIDIAFPLPLFPDPRSAVKSIDHSIRNPFGHCNGLSVVSF
jgi:hypothetical protein